MSVKKSDNYFSGRAKIERDDEDFVDVLTDREPRKTRAVVYRTTVKTFISLSSVSSYLYSCVMAVVAEVSTVTRRYSYEN